jgi:hypothetical protein
MGIEPTSEAWDAVLWAVSMKAKEFTLEGSCDGHGWIRSTSK